MEYNIEYIQRKMCKLITFIYVYIMYLTFPYTFTHYTHTHLLSILDSQSPDYYIIHIQMGSVYPISTHIAYMDLRELNT